MKNSNYIGFWERVWMLIIDSVLLSIGLLCFNILVNRILGVEANSDLDYTLKILLISSTTLFFWIKFGGTPGLLLRKAKIVTGETGEMPSVGRFLIRLISCLLSNMSLFLSYIFLAFDSRKQTWHDKFSQTVLVRNITATVSEGFPTNHTKKDNYILIIGIILCLALYFCMAVFVNLILEDEPLIKQAKEWIGIDVTEEINPEENSFYYMLGILADPELSSYEEGYNRVQKLNEEFLDNRSKKLKNVYDLSDDFPNTTRFEKVMKPLQYMMAENLLEYVEENETTLTKIRNEYEYALKRYNELMKYNYFQNSYYKSSMDDLYPIYHLKRLNIAHAILLYNRGDEQGFMDVMKREVNLSRYLIESTETAELKQLALVMLETDLIAIFQILHEDSSFDLDYLNLAYLTKSEVSLKKIVTRGFILEYQEKIEYLKRKEIAQPKGYLDQARYNFEKALMSEFNFYINRIYKTWMAYYNLEELPKEEIYAYVYEQPEYEPYFVEKLVGSILYADFPLLNGVFFQMKEVDAKIEMIKELKEEGHN